MNKKEYVHPNILVEPLTAREEEVLLLLAEHMRYQDIAERLTLALSSIKWYTQQIYSKLGVDNRRDAIERAQVSGLLSPSASVERRRPATKPFHNLPRPLTRFIGREKEINEVVDLINQNPLVTLIGSGGVGKTRLALQVSRQLVYHYSHGAWQVELAPIVNPDLVPRAVAAVMGVQEIPSHSLTESLLHALREKQVLLVLDNCEHLLDAVACLVEKLLSGCPNLTVLATSREALSVSGEVAYRVPSLSIPEIKGHPTVSDMLVYDAVDLFIDRAIKVQPGFRLTKENSLAVTNICCRLDGIPLAIELAAARINVLSVDQVAARLVNAFQFLNTGLRTALPRHKTLRALVDWSFDLLPEEERRLLARLSIFAGGWSLEAAEEICSDRQIPGLQRENIFQGIVSLANKSLIIPVQDEHQPRFSMLETIRQYGQEKMVGYGDDQEIYKHHLDYFLAWTMKIEPLLRGQDQVEVLDSVELELDNLRIAINWSIENDPEKGLLVTARLRHYWHLRGRKSEGIASLFKLLSADEKLHSQLVPESTLKFARARGLFCLGWLIWVVEPSRRDEATTFIEKSYQYFLELGPQGNYEIGYPLMYLCDRAYNKGELDHARELGMASITALRESNYRFGEAECMSWWGNNEMDWGDRLRAKDLLEGALAIHRECCDKDGIAWNLFSLSSIAFAEGNIEQAVVLSQDSLVQMKANKSIWIMIVAYKFIGEMAWVRGLTDEAVELFEKALVISRDIGDIVWTVVILYDLAVCRKDRSEFDIAAKDYDRAWAALPKMPVSLRTILDYGTAELALLQGDIPLSMQLFDRMEYSTENIEYKKAQALRFYGKGKCSIVLGDWRTSRMQFRQALKVWSQIGDRYGMLDCLEGLLQVYSAQGQWAQAGLLLGFIQGIRQKFGAPISIFGLKHPLIARIDLKPYNEKIKDFNGLPEADRLIDIGRAMTLEAIVTQELKEDLI